MTITLIEPIKKMNQPNTQADDFDFGQSGEVKKTPFFQKFTSFFNKDKAEDKVREQARKSDTTATCSGNCGTCANKCSQAMLKDVAKSVGKGRQPNPQYMEELRKHIPDIDKRLESIKNGDRHARKELLDDLKGVSNNLLQEQISDRSEKLATRIAQGTITSSELKAEVKALKGMGKEFTADSFSAETQKRIDNLNQVLKDAGFEAVKINTLKVAQQEVPLVQIAVANYKSEAMAAVAEHKIANGISENPQSAIKQTTISEYKNLEANPSSAVTNSLSTSVDKATLGNLQDSQRAHSSPVEMVKEQKTGGADRVQELASRSSNSLPEPSQRASNVPLTEKLASHDVIATSKAVVPEVSSVRQVAHNANHQVQELQRPLHNNANLSKQIANIEQVLNNSRLSSQVAERMAVRQLQELVRTLSRNDMAGLSQEVSDRLRRMQDQLKQNLVNKNNSEPADRRQIELAMRQIRAALNNNDRQGQATSRTQNIVRTDLNRLSAIESTQRAVLNRLSLLQERLKMLQGDLKNIDKLAPKERVQLNDKNRALKEQIDRLERMSAKISLQKREILNGAERDKIVLSKQGNEVPLRRSQDLQVMREMLLTVIRNAQINSAVFKAILANRLATLLKDQALLATASNDMIAQRVKRLMEMQQMLREGQELSLEMMQEMLELLSAMQEEGEGEALVTRKGKRVTRVKKTKKLDSKGHGLELEQSTEKQKVKTAGIPAPVGSSAKSNQSEQTKEGAKKGGPSGSLDVFQKEIGGKSNSYYEGENDEQEEFVIA